MPNEKLAALLTIELVLFLRNRRCFEGMRNLMVSICFYFECLAKNTLDR